MSIVDDMKCFPSICKSHKELLLRDNGTGLQIWFIWTQVLTECRPIKVSDNRCKSLLQTPLSSENRTDDTFIQFDVTRFLEVEWVLRFDRLSDKKSYTDQIFWELKCLGSWKAHIGWYVNERRNDILLIVSSTAAHLYLCPVSVIISQCQ